MSGDWYDLAECYDFLYDVDTPKELRFLLRMARLHGREPLRVLEPACGSGRLLRAFAARGSAASGFDRNPRALAYARDRLRALCLRARLSRQDLADFDCGRNYDLAHCLLSSFKYLRSDRAAQSHLQSVARALRLGGLYVLALHLCDPQERRWSRERWQRRVRGVSVSVELATSPPDLRRRREQVRVHLQADWNGRAIQRRESWSWRTWTDLQLRALLARVPQFELAAVTDFDFRRRQLEDDRLDKILVLRRVKAPRG